MKRTLSIHRKLTVTLQFIMLIGLALALYERLWLNSLLILGIVIITLLPLMLRRRMQIYIPPPFEMLAILFVFASVFLGEIRNYYVKYWWWDSMLHTGSGLLLGIFGFLLVYTLNEEEHIELYMKPRFVALFSFVFAVAVGAVWEIFEFAMDEVFHMNMQKSGLVDTMWDLIVDSIGALFISVLGYLYMKKAANILSSAGSPVLSRVTPSCSGEKNQEINEEVRFGRPTVLLKTLPEHDAVFVLECRL